MSNTLNAKGGLATPLGVAPTQQPLPIQSWPDLGSASTFWTDSNSLGHKIALFADGTGKSTTGSTLSETAGAVVSFSWSMAGPDAVAIAGCPDCSFQRIDRIAGSVSDGTFTGQVVTKGGLGLSALDSFVLTSGGL